MFLFLVTKSFWIKFILVLVMDIMLKFGEYWIKMKEKNYC